MSRKHQLRLRRMGYQFPAARKFIQDGDLRAGWIVPILHSTGQLYAVVRYSPHGDDIAWVESESHFGTDEAKALAWIMQTFQELRKEEKEQQY